MDDLLNTLNDEQKLAVAAINGPVMVFAGAGTGKTKTLIARIVNMIQNEKIEPNTILAITFTKKATAEMRERLTKVLGEQIAKKVNISTIHSLCNRILRRHIPYLGYDRDFEIIDDDEMLKVITEVYRTNKNFDRKLLSPRIMVKAIGDYKNGIRPLKIEENEVFEEYNKYLKNNNMVDLDDLLILTNNILDIKEVLDYYQNQFKYILVDEFQDTNPIQYDIIKKIGAKHQNIFVVGDDDQSIYSFRGACIDNILSFTKDYPNAQVFKLVQNYRSNDVILKGANAMIKNNVIREPKELFTKIKGALTDVTVYSAYYYEDEVRYVVNEIIHLVNQHKCNYSDIAILYRNNAISRNFELGLIESSIPYNLYGGFSYLKRKEIKDVISYLRFILDDSKIVHFKRIIDRPSRGIGEKTLAKLFEAMDSNHLTVLQAIDVIYEENPSTKNQALKDFKEVIIELRNSLEKMDLVSFFDLLVEKTGYLEMIKAEDEEEANRVNNLMEFKSILFNIENNFIDQDFTQKQKIESSLDEIVLDQSYGENQTKDAVVVSTVHSIKGLEFKSVFVVGLEEGIFPALREDVDMEEERRVAYVAFTRAKERLYLTSSNRRLIYGRIVRNNKSRFLTEFLVSDELKDMIQKKEDERKEKKDIHVGSKIEHTFFGYGLVIAIDERFVQILFEKDNTIRKFTKDHPTITVLDE